MTEDQARARVVAAMCPDRVCRTCGEPSKRIVERVTELRDRHPEFAQALRSAREQQGMSQRDVDALFGYNGMCSHWERAIHGDQSQPAYPNPDQWPILKERLGLPDTFDDLVNSDRRWTESEVEYRDVSDAPSGWTQDGNGRVYQRLASRKDRIAPEVFSDCGHDDWRPGVWLDPFAVPEKQ